MHIFLRQKKVKYCYFKKLFFLSLLCISKRNESVPARRLSHFIIMLQLYAYQWYCH